MQRLTLQLFSVNRAKKVQNTILHVGCLGCYVSTDVWILFCFCCFALSPGVIFLCTCHQDHKLSGLLPLLWVQFTNPVSWLVAFTHQYSQSCIYYRGAHGGVYCGYNELNMVGPIVNKCNALLCRPQFTVLCLKFTVILQCVNTFINQSINRSALLGIHLH